MAAAVEDLVNQALRALGARRRIGSIYEGSEAAKVALEVYGQTRDALLRSKSWSFAQQTVPLVALVAVPPWPWPYEYVWPVNCLLVRGILPPLFPSPNFSPSDILFTPYNDPVSGRAILTTVSPATAVFTAQVTNPAQWEAGFTGALVAALATALDRALADPAMIGSVAAQGEQARDVALGGSELQPPSDVPMPVRSVPSPQRRGGE